MLENLFRRITDLQVGVSQYPSAPQLPLRYSPKAEELIAKDGDNVLWRGQNCRLKGYDAPEQHRKRETKFDLERTRGRKAQERLAALIAGAERLEIKHEGKFDRFKRPLINLYINGVDVSAIAIYEGWGIAYEQGKKPHWWREDMHFSAQPKAPWDFKA